jgi:hypothetical protein
MLRRLLLLDLLLVAVLVAGSLKIRAGWLEFRAAHRVESVQPAAEPAISLPAMRAAAPGGENWTEIVARNPFSFDRNDVAILAPPPPSPAAAAAAAKPVLPKPFLFGTFGIGKTWQATLASGQPGNRKSKVMAIGESIDGWQLVEIHNGSVVVLNGAVRETLSMDATVSVQRDATRTLVEEAQPIVVQQQTPKPSAETPAPAPALGANPANPSAPPGEAKGHYVETPFGRRFILDP